MSGVIVDSVDFNPRPREEGDTAFIVICLPISYFNPRPREEGDQRYWNIRKSEYISIHALVKRATIKFVVFPLDRGISIHALVKRATCYNIPCR